MTLSKGPMMTIALLYLISPHISSGTMIDLTLYKQITPPEDDYPRRMYATSRQHFPSVGEILFLLFFISLLVKYEIVVKHESPNINSEVIDLFIEEKIY